MGLVTLTFDLFILKRVCESHQREGIFLPNLGTLGLWVLELFATYTTGGQTDGQTKTALIAPSLRAGGIINTPFGVGRLSRAPARRRGRNLKFRFLEVLSPDPRAKFRRPRSSVLGALGF